MPLFRCDTCHGTTDSPTECRETECYAMGDATVSQVGIYLACDAIGCKGECEAIAVCDVCGERECQEGCDVCLQCLTDSVQADPMELENCTRDLQVVIAKELARRNRLWLAMPQAH